MNHYIVCYLILINLISFFSFALDKQKAIKGKYRISERRLFILAILGGSPASIAAMYIFHHKTRKPSFRFGMPVIMIIQITTAIYLLI